MDHKQRGAILVVSLIMLLILTVFGALSMKQSGTNELTSANYRDRDTAFEAAEAALKHGEFVASQSVRIDFENGCVGNSCFTAPCSNGRCFTTAATFNDFSTPTISPCSVTPPATPLWEDPTMWTPAGSYATHTNGVDNESQPAKFIVEFLCFTDAVAGTPGNTTSYDNTWAFTYRVTALGYGEG